jgi:SAM-dependent methyltransferase
VTADPAAYAAWYETRRGAWIGGAEFALLRQLVRPRPDESVLDVGCGTGYFTGCFARETDRLAVGLDPDFASLTYAAGHAPSRIVWVAGRGEALPFPDRSFDVVVSVTALCFVADQERAIREMLRVCRRSFALGLLNRHSLLWWQKGRGGGAGAYRGARWHTPREARELLNRATGRSVQLRTAVFLPGGGRWARALERRLPAVLPWGAFLAVAGNAG